MKVRIATLSYYIWACLLILQCQTMYAVHQNRLLWFVTLLVYSIGQCAFLIYETRIPSRLFQNTMLILGGYYGIEGVLLLRNLSENLSRDFILLNLIGLPVFIVTLTLMIFRKELKDFLLAFNRIVVVFAVLSLFFWFFGSLLGILKPSGTVVNAWSGGNIVNSYYHLYYETQRIGVMGFTFIRNSAFFTEGPMWNLIISLAFIIELFLLEELSKWRLVVILLTAATIFSTTGIYVIGIGFLAHVLLVRKSRFRFLSLLATPALVYALTRVIEDKAASNSAAIRMDDYVAGFNAWRDRLITGWGFSGLGSIEYYMNGAIRPNYGYSNSFFVVLAQGGIIQGIVQFAPFMALFAPGASTNRTKCAISLYFILILTTIFYNTMLFNVIAATAYAALINKITLNH